MLARKTVAHTFVIPILVGKRRLSARVSAHLVLQRRQAQLEHVFVLDVGRAALARQCATGQHARGEATKRLRRGCCGAGEARQRCTSRGGDAPAIEECRSKHAMVLCRFVVARIRLSVVKNCARPLGIHSDSKSGAVRSLLVGMCKVHIRSKNSLPLFLSAVFIESRNPSMIDQSETSIRQNGSCKKRDTSNTCRGAISVSLGFNTAGKMN
jgi:hypothetical protein